MAQSQLAALGSLLSDDTRAGLLTVLMDGRAHTGGELARYMGVSPSTASEHLSKLRDGGFVTVDAQGRHRYFRLATAEIAQLLETLGAAPVPIVSAPRPSTPASLVFARTCYDHLAGKLAVRIFDQLLADGILVEKDHALQLSAEGNKFLTGIGMELDLLQQTRRPTAKKCLDWSERRHHLAGAAGSALLQLMIDRGWVGRGRQPRSIRVTRLGATAIPRSFGISS